jgi:hypothetical protein
MARDSHFGGWWLIPEHNPTPREIFYSLDRVTFIDVTRAAVAALTPAFI